MTSIKQLLAKGPTYSFEFMPPKCEQERGRLVTALRDLEPYHPDFVSVTYRGGRASRRMTHDLVVGMKTTSHLNPMGHLITAVHTRLELAQIIVDYRKAGIKNLLALGGDPAPGDEGEFAELAHADELVELARAIGMESIGVAAHPEGHPDSHDLQSDRKHLAHKLDLADFAITQFFFKVEDYLRLVNDLADRGVNKPVVPGIMPVTNANQVKRFAELSGAAFPSDLADRLEPVAGDQNEVRKIGIEVASELCEELMAAGAPGLHFYTLNNSTATREIYHNLDLVSR